MIKPPKKTKTHQLILMRFLFERDQCLGWVGDNAIANGLESSELVL